MGDDDWADRLWGYACSLAPLVAPMLAVSQCNQQNREESSVFEPVSDFRTPLLVPHDTNLNPPSGLQVPLWDMSGLPEELQRWYRQSEILRALDHPTLFEHFTCSETAVKEGRWWTLWVIFTVLVCRTCWHHKEKSPA
jgi:hypothetical protein